MKWGLEVESETFQKHSVYILTDIKMFLQPISYRNGPSSPGIYNYFEIISETTGDLVQRHMQTL